MGLATDEGNAMKHFMLTKKLLAVGADYKVTNEAGVVAFTVDGKVRFGITFDVLDAERQVVVKGREKVLALDRRFDFSNRDGTLLATMRRLIVGGHRRILGTPDYQYQIETADTDDKALAEIAGPLIKVDGFVCAQEADWRLAREGRVLASVQEKTQGHAVHMTAEGLLVPFILATTVALLRLEPGSSSGSSSD
jgi:uncharacterized protein YxjI